MTRIDLRLEKATGAPVCVGSGFVALDIVQGESGSFAATGGSCGNVMAILAWLGWSAHISSGFYPVGMSELRTERHTNTDICTKSRVAR